MDCDWTIQADPGRNVQLIFLSFELEDIENCTYDYVEVYAGMEDTSGSLYGRYCGSNVSKNCESRKNCLTIFALFLQNPPDIISLTDSLLVRFRSDDTMSKKGFSASYVAVDPFDNIEEVSSDSSEMVTPFPGYLKPIYKADSYDYDEYRDYSENHLQKNYNPWSSNIRRV